MSPVDTILTVSTAHVTDDTLKLLQEDPEKDTTGLEIYPKNEFGYLIYAQRNGHFDDNQNPLFGYLGGVPKDLMTILQYADSLGCHIVCLDCDGPVLPWLTDYTDADTDTAPNVTNNSAINVGDVVFACINGNNRQYVVKNTDRSDGVYAFGAPESDDIFIPNEQFVKIPNSIFHAAKDIVYLGEDNGPRSLYCTNCKTFICSYQPQEKTTNASHQHACGRPDVTELSLADALEK